MCVAPPTIGGLGWQPVSEGEESAGMDGSHFDQLVRTLGHARSRRQALRGLAGAVVAGALALGGLEGSADDCKANGKACKKDGQCCSHHCVGASGRSTAHSGGVCQPASVCTPETLLGA